MSLYIGNQKLGSLYLGSTKIKEAWVGDVKVYGSGDPYNPLNLPPFTIRCKFAQAPAPWHTEWDNLVLVDQAENVWDITKNSTNWTRLLAVEYVTEVLGANTRHVERMDELFASCNYLYRVVMFDTSDVTDMSYMFQSCISLTSVPLFDTSSCTNMNSMFADCSTLADMPILDTSLVTNMYQMFAGCNSLTSIPPLDTSSCNNTSMMFAFCREIESGSLEFYQRVSSQHIIPNRHDAMFWDCGINTPTGLAELQQIPQSWGGLA